MIRSRLTKKARTTIPKAVRTALALCEGDHLAYVIEEGRVMLQRAGTLPVDGPFATFAEWGGEAVRRAYADL